MDHRDERLEYNKEWRENNPGYDKEWRKANRERWCEYARKWRKVNTEYQKEYDENNRDEIIKKSYIRKMNIISELCEQYDGDLWRILENIPDKWHVREAKMQVWFGESYYDGMIAKIESTPVCEVTGKTKDLVIHHLYSFNTHPELGNDPANMVRIATSVHNDFHKIYGYGNNTLEQWLEFVENL